MQRLTRIFGCYERTLGRRREDEDARRLRFTAHLEVSVRVDESRDDAGRLYDRNSIPDGALRASDARDPLAFDEQHAVVLWFTELVVQHSEAKRERAHRSSVMGPRLRVAALRR